MARLMASDSTVRVICRALRSVLVGPCAADFIILGSPSRTGLERILLGSTAEREPHHTTSAVMGVKTS
jgi:nucleotide-binding universal stress UspA family protein